MPWGRPFGVVPTAQRIHRNNADLGIGEAPPPPPPRKATPASWWRRFWCSPEPQCAPLSTLDRLDGLDRPRLRRDQ
jgi:hypothetical protein